MLHRWKYRNTIIALALSVLLFVSAGSFIDALVGTANYALELSDHDILVTLNEVENIPALENAMALDVAMGGSTNTVLHLLAAANEGEIPFVMADIDRVSRRVPCLCKVSPATHDYYVEDVHRAGGIRRRQDRGDGKTA